MANAFGLERRLMALVLSAACAVACGGSASENAVATGGATAAGGNTQSAGSGGASVGSGGAGGSVGVSGAANGGAANGGASTGGIGGSCEQAKEDYAALVTSLLAESSNESCVVGTDCQYLPTSDCGNGCSISVASSAASPAITAQLAAFAAAHCTGCTFPILPCPGLFLPATQCIAGECK
ncbi:MAG TPA: hypothetical protein VK745_01080 [Polyangiaceae bacterium]|nr:hypothetical protein [Polyangiaceae bacterium]